MKVTWLIEREIQVKGKQNKSLREADAHGSILAYRGEKSHVQVIRISPKEADRNKSNSADEEE